MPGQRSLEIVSAKNGGLRTPVEEPVTRREECELDDCESSVKYAGRSEAHVWVWPRCCKKCTVVLLAAQ